MSVSCGGTGQQWPATRAGALGAADLGMAQALLEEVAINLTTEPSELTQDWETDSGRAQTEPCTPGPRRKEQQPHKRLTQTCPGVSKSLWQMRGSVVGCCRVGGTECSSTCMGPFEGGRHYLHYLHHSLASSQTTGKEHSPAHQQKIELKIY